MKGIVTGLKSFSQIIEAGNIYVDKTGYVYRMVRRHERCYFVSRPRGFGKSLMCSTLDALFSGKKELFKDLTIGKTDYDFRAYPVLRFDFSKLSTSTCDDFLHDLKAQLNESAKENGVSISTQYPSSMMDEMLMKLDDPVIIIDEFDSPLVDAVSRGDKELAERISVVFNSFYKVIKSHSGTIRFLFITGSTKMTVRTIFSAMNNLKDISDAPEYAGMSGYTEEELLTVFSGHIEQKLALPDCAYKSKDEFLTALRDYYGGYRFSPWAETRVYNPLSIGRYFSDSGSSFNNYWTSTDGMSSLAVTLSRSNDLLRLVEKRVEFDSDELAVFDVLSLVDDYLPRRLTLPLLYFAGYLTIADADRRYVILDFPNEEARKLFLPTLTGTNGDQDSTPV